MFKHEAMRCYENMGKEAGKGIWSTQAMSAEMMSTKRINLQMQLKINVLSMAQIQVHGNSRLAISNNDSNTTGYYVAIQMIQKTAHFRYECNSTFNISDSKRGPQCNSVYAKCVCTPVHTTPYHEMLTNT
jgi:hypothetical protein